MRILHVLDHSLPLHSGYSFRTQGILSAQRARGWETVQLTSAKQLDCTAPEEQIDGWLYHRSPPLGSLVARMPVVNQWGVVRSLERRLNALVPQCRPDIVHAHSPALTGIAAARVARRFGVPFLYECRAFWEDAAVDHGTTSEGSLRYRVTRDLETWVCRRADAITTICEGIRGDLAGRGLPGENITVIPNAVDLAEFECPDTRPAELAAKVGLAGRTIVGFIGSFYAYEGLELALAALPAIAARIPTSRCSSSAADRRRKRCASAHASRISRAASCSRAGCRTRRSRATTISSTCSSIRAARCGSRSWSRR
jgi:PEP-CTERM/exosortase A-associated glycosyltransferase